MSIRETAARILMKRIGARPGSPAHLHAPQRSGWDKFSLTPASLHSLAFLFPPWLSCTVPPPAAISISRLSSSSFRSCTAASVSRAGSDRSRHTDK